jgi:hypothetical protein
MLLGHTSRAFQASREGKDRRGEEREGLIERRGRTPSASPLTLATQGSICITVGRCITHPTTSACKILNTPQKSLNIVLCLADDFMRLESR